LASLPYAPTVPPLPLPIVVLVASIIVMVLGGGAWGGVARRNESCR
jgi:hypothetical protein